MILVMIRLIPLPKSLPYTCQVPGLTCKRCVVMIVIIAAGDAASACQAVAGTGWQPLSPAAPREGGEEAVCRSLPFAGEGFTPPLTPPHRGSSWGSPPPGPSFAQTLENTVLFCVFDGWKGAKFGNLLNSEAILIPI